MPFCWYGRAPAQIRERLFLIHKKTNRFYRKRIVHEHNSVNDFLKCLVPTRRCQNITFEDTIKEQRFPVVACRGAKSIVLKISSEKVFSKIIYIDYNRKQFIFLSKFSS